jgi:hypothetical protein
MEALDLRHLPDLPQQKTIREVATALWQQQEVIALWLGGSLACGVGDVFSDIDFRVAVAPSHLAYWQGPSFERVFPHTSVVGQQFLRFGEHAFLHHLVLSNGELFDLSIQSAESELTPEPHQILGCRSDLFARKLAQSQRTSPVMESALPMGEALRSLLIDFWINTHKHGKVLHRSLDLLCVRRIQKERETLLRLWSIQVSGRDYGATRESLHSLTKVMSTLGRATVPQVLLLLGTPTRNRQELIRVIEMNREVVSKLGRHFAHQYGFEYPSTLEATVLQSWQEFGGSHPMGNELLTPSEQS